MEINSCSKMGEPVLVPIFGAVPAAIALLFVISVATAVGQTSDADVVTVQSR